MSACFTALDRCRFTEGADARVSGTSGAYGSKL
jgi:hypothetical protein